MNPTSHDQPSAVTLQPVGQVVSPRDDLSDDNWGEVPASRVAEILRTTVLDTERQ